MGFAWSTPAAVGDAQAAGALTQQAGTAGCISETGTAGLCGDGTGLDGASSVAVSPDGKSAYGASLFSDAVVVFDRDLATGALTQKAGIAGCISDTGSGGACVDGTALDGAFSVTVSADGTSVYAGSLFSDAVVVFDRDLATGALTQKAGTAGCISDTGSGGACVDGTALDEPYSVAVSADGKSVYAATFYAGAVVVLDRDPATGALTQKPGTAGCISNTGSGGACVDGTATGGASSVAVSADGKSVYSASQTSDAVAVFDRDPATGALTQKPGTAGCISETGTAGACADGKALDGATEVVLSADGKSVYSPSLNSDAVVVFDRNPATGALTQKAGTAGCISETGTGGACADGRALDAARSIVVSADGESAYAASQNSNAVVVFDRTAATGALTQKAGAAGCISETGTAGACGDGRALIGARGVAISPEGKSVYAASQTSDAVAVFDRDQTVVVPPLPKSLPAVVRTSTTWLLRDSATTGPPTTSFTYGTPPLAPLMGDWDGNGSRTAGTYSAGTFKLRNANAAGPANITFTFGDRRGYPVAGDFNGDGTDDVAVFREGLWQVRLSTGATSSFTYGSGLWPATVPVTGDWNDDGIDGVGIYTYGSATWELRNSASAGPADAGSFVFGTAASSYPVPADFDGDGLDSVAVKTGITWAARSTNTAGPAELTFDYGLADDLPLTWRMPAAP